MGHMAIDPVLLALLALLIVRQEMIHMSTTNAITDLTNEVTQLETDEVTEKEALTTIIADFEDLQNNVNTTQTLEALVTRLKALDAANQADTSAVKTADPGTTPPVTPST